MLHSWGGRTVRGYAYKTWTTYDRQMFPLSTRAIAQRERKSWGGLPGPPSEPAAFCRLEPGLEAGNHAEMIHQMPDPAPDGPHTDSELLSNCFIG